MSKVAATQHSEDGTIVTGSQSAIREKEAGLYHDNAQVGLKSDEAKVWYDNALVCIQLAPDEIRCQVELDEICSPRQTSRQRADGYLWHWLYIS